MMAVLMRPIADELVCCLVDMLERAVVGKLVLKVGACEMLCLEVECGVGDDCSEGF